MKDLISRQAAIEICKKYISAGAVCTEIMCDIEDLPPSQPEPKWDEWCTDCKEYDQDRHCCPRFNRVIRETVDEIEPERKTGKWINVGSLSCRCSECGCKSAKETSYCPNCGTKMRD